MQFESPFVIHRIALHEALEGICYFFEKRLLPSERASQPDLSAAAYLQIAVGIFPNCIIVLNLEKFLGLVYATLIDLYPMFALYAPPRNITSSNFLKSCTMWCETQRTF